MELRKQTTDGYEFSTPVFRHKQEALLVTAVIEESLQQAFPVLLESLEKWVNLGSGWTVSTIQTLWVDIVKYEPLKGSSFSLLPKDLQSKKAIFNPINREDSYCFLWCVLLALTKVPRHPERIRWYEPKPFKIQCPKMAKKTLTGPGLEPETSGLTYQRSSNMMQCSLSLVIANSSVNCMM